MLDPKDLLPPPPWEGPPIPRILLEDSRLWGAWERDFPAEMRLLWRRAWAETVQKYPIGHRVLVSEAKRAGVSQEEIQLWIAHDLYLERRQEFQVKELREHPIEEEVEVEKEVEDEEE